MTHPPYDEDELELETWKEKLLYRFILEKKHKLEEMQSRAAIGVVLGFCIGLLIGALMTRFGL